MNAFEPPSGGPGPAADPLLRMVSPLGGLVGGVHRYRDVPGEPAVPLCGAALGDVTQALPPLAAHPASRRAADGLDGSGGAADPEDARRLAVAEALERYCAAAFSPEQLITATAAELGPEALDLDTLPRLSAAELALPGQRLRAPDRTAPLRWIRGIRLHDARPLWIPAVHVHLTAYATTPQEAITHPISTGCAGHTDPHLALAKGLCEVIERDAIALTWLQMLPLPRIVPIGLPDHAAAMLARFEGHPGIRIELFDATTDIGVPTVYAVRIAEHSSRFRTVVACSTEPDPAEAVVKVVREAISCRFAYGSVPERDVGIDEFTETFDGALYMARAEHAKAFDFLLRTPSAHRFCALPRLDHTRPERLLADLVDRLLAAGYPAYAVDLSTDEAREAGVTVVRTLVPGLQPLSFVHRAQYRAHPRLYEGPRRVGHRVRAEAELNPWPQPFA
ncbi:YcaO-like family protein [Streptomyces sp. KR80]|uniref:YcaO-like family protein n=1 Tax=Streptomyces sp. KR80 TaxID=3457426 RepID=UPI003FD27A46